MSRWAAAMQNAQDNPDVVVIDDTDHDEERPPIAPSTAWAEQWMPTTNTKKNTLSANFEKAWQALGGPLLDAEVRFHPQRRWRFDYCHIDTKTAIELEGGIYSNGRHTRASGYQKDCEKYNAAQVLGYTVFRLATGMITPDNIQPIIKHIAEREAAA